jgi:antirestriction protein ArdC
MAALLAGSFCEGREDRTEPQSNKKKTMKTKTNRKQQKSESELQSRPEPLRNRKAKAAEGKASLYQTVTDRIIASLKAGVIPWEKPWKSPRFEGGPFPRNYCTGKPYRGINILLLWGSSFNSPFWLTYKQAQELKGTVRKGEKGTQIVFYKHLRERESDTTQTKNEQDRPPFILCHYTVFNVEQCDGLKIPEMTERVPNEVEPDEACEALIDGYENRPKLVLNGERENRAYYQCIYPPAVGLSMRPIITARFFTS